MEVSIPAGADLRHRLGHPKESLMHLILAGANSSLGRPPPPNGVILTPLIYTGAPQRDQQKRQEPCYVTEALWRDPAM